MTSFLSTLSQVVTASIDWMMEYLDVILGTPALLALCVGFPLVNMAVNLVRRLIRL